MINEIKKELLEISDRKYKNFSSALLPGINNVIGVRLPVLRKMAKKIANGNYKEFIAQNDHQYMELTMLEGMVIGSIRANEEEIFEQIENFIPKINTWSVCDSFCCSIKIFAKDKEKTKRFLEKYLNSTKEFEVRFFYVALLTYFLNYDSDDYEYVISQIAKFNNDDYYAKMGAAWCLSVCLVKNFEKCYKDIQNLKIHPWVLNKGIIKATESFRLTKEQKELLRSIKK